GFYTLRGAGGEETVFAANLGSEVESTLEPVEQLRVGDLRAGSTSRAEAGLRREIWLYLVLFALLVLTLEWFTYHRRWTV
ncbi:MAG: VWA domain-containing protein, partial [Myxococcales bacterium]|nr:VWA domain-containing protein [Myxococcales bacterium]